VGHIFSSGLGLLFREANLDKPPTKKGVKKRKLEKNKDEKNSAPYQFTIGTLSKKASFINKMYSAE
jgi:hypothetical protein